MAKKQQPGCTCCGCKLNIQVQGCANIPVPAGLTVNVKSGGSTVGTGTTDADGNVSIDGTAGTYDVEVVDGRTPSRWQTETNPSVVLACDASYEPVFVTTPKSGYHCSLFCGDPLKDTLTATDPNGAWTLTYNALNALGAGWYGCATHTSMASVVTALAGATCFRTTGTGNVNYVIQLLEGSTTISDYWGYLDQAPRTTMSTPTCASGSLTLSAGIPAGCVGIVVRGGGGASGTAASCPPSLSITATMPSTGTASTANPGAGSITITE